MSRDQLNNGGNTPSPQSTPLDPTSPSKGTDGATVPDGEFSATRSAHTGSAAARSEWEELRSLTPSTAERALEEIRPLLKTADEEFTQTVLVHGLRVGDPAHFRHLSVRAEVLRALAPYGKDPDISLAAAQTLKTDLHSPEVCSAAFEVLKGSGPTLSTPVLQVLDSIVDSALRQPLDQLGLPGAKYALMTLGRDPHDALEDAVGQLRLRQEEESIQSAKISLLRDSKRISRHKTEWGAIRHMNEGTIAELLKLGTDRSVGLVCDLAEGKAIECRLSRWEAIKINPDGPWTNVSKGLVVATIGMSAGAIIGAAIGSGAHYTLFLGACAAGLFAAIANSLPRTIAALVDRPVDAKVKPDPEVRDMAIRQLARTLPSERARRIILKELQNGNSAFLKTLNDSEASPNGETAEKVFLQALLLTTRDRFLAEQFGKRLQNAQSQEVVGALVAALASPEACTRLGAVTALLGCADETVRAKVLAMRRDSDTEVSIAAERAVRF